MNIHAMKTILLALQNWERGDVYRLYEAEKALIDEFPEIHKQAVEELVNSEPIP